MAQSVRTHAFIAKGGFNLQSGNQDPTSCVVQYKNNKNKPKVSIINTFVLYFIANGNKKDQDYKKEYYSLGMKRLYKYKQHDEKRCWI